MSKHLGDLHLGVFPIFGSWRPTLFQLRELTMSQGCRACRAHPKSRYSKQRYLMLRLLA
jgi:hypothetical protein